MTRRKSHSEFVRHVRAMREKTLQHSSRAVISTARAPQAGVTSPAAKVVDEATRQLIRDYDEQRGNK